MLVFVECHRYLNHSLRIKVYNHSEINLFVKKQKCFHKLDYVWPTIARRDTFIVLKSLRTGPMQVFSRVYITSRFYEKMANPHFTINIFWDWGMGAKCFALICSIMWLRTTVWFVRAQYIIIGGKIFLHTSCKGVATNEINIIFKTYFLRLTILGAV